MAFNDLQMINALSLTPFTDLAELALICNFVEDIEVMGDEATLT